MLWSAWKDWKIRRDCWQKFPSSTFVVLALNFSLTKANLRSRSHVYSNNIHIMKLWIANFNPYILTLKIYRFLLFFFKQCSSPLSYKGFDWFYIWVNLNITNPRVRDWVRDFIGYLYLIFKNKRKPMLFK